MTTWNETTPAGTEFMSGGDDAIRDTKAAVRERLEREHAMQGSGDSADDGKHRLAHGLASARPAAVAGHVYIATDTLIVSVSPADGVWIELRSDDPPGVIKMFGGSTAPNGWLICNGNAVSRTTYSALFWTIGGMYGIGDGSTTFNLPDLKGRVPIGYDSSQSEFNVLGKFGGEKTHILSEAELYPHTHTATVVDPGHKHQETVVAAPGSIEAGGGYGIIWSDTTTSLTGISVHNSWTGSGQAHNNLQPFVTVNYIIKY